MIDPKSITIDPLGDDELKAFVDALRRYGLFVGRIKK
jgi:hypothetical protein